MQEEIKDAAYSGGGWWGGVVREAKSGSSKGLMN